MHYLKTYTISKPFTITKPFTNYVKLHTLIPVPFTISVTYTNYRNYCTRDMNFLMGDLKHTRFLDTI